MRMQVQSLALLSGLSIWHYHELWCMSQTWLGSGIAMAMAVAEASNHSSDSTPGLGTSICHRCGPKKNQNQNNNNNKPQNAMVQIYVYRQQRRYSERMRLPVPFLKSVLFLPQYTHFVTNSPFPLRPRFCSAAKDHYQLNREVKLETVNQQELLVSHLKSCKYCSVTPIP